MENENELGKALEESLNTFDLEKLARENIESAIDFLTENPIVEAIPIVKFI